MFNGLRRIFVEFAKHAFDKKSTGIKDANGGWTPFYDHLHQVVLEEMKSYKMNGKTNISSIPDPFGTSVVWSRSVVDFGLFENMYAEIIQKAREEASKNSGWLKLLLG